MMQRSLLVTKAVVAAGVLVAGLAVGAGSAAAQEVNLDFDRQADFSKCATYAWAKGQPAQDPLVDKRIVTAIDAALASKGMRKVENNPGCYVTYHASVKEQRSLEIWDGGGRFRGGFGSVDVKTVLDGMLVVDIADAASHQLIWRAVAKDTVSDKPEKNQKKLAKVMDKMFKTFPSGSAK
jgi:Domain of unknown function (DUF4136)